MPEDCKTCGYHETFNTKLDHISKGIDELKKDKQRLWDRSDQHSDSISFLKAVVATLAFVIPIIGGIIGYFLGKG